MTRTPWMSWCNMQREGRTSNPSVAEYDDNATWRHQGGYLYRIAGERGARYSGVSCIFVRARSSHKYFNHLFMVPSMIRRSNQYWYDQHNTSPVRIALIEKYSLLPPTSIAFVNSWCCILRNVNSTMAIHRRPVRVLLPHVCAFFNS